MTFTGTVQYDIKFFGWMFNAAENNDKIWGWIEIEGKLYNFWGRRDNGGDGKAIKFKRHDTGWDGRHDLQTLTRGKERKGYKAMSLQRAADGTYPAIDEIYPNFQAHMKKQLMFARLTGTVKNEAV